MSTISFVNYFLSIYVSFFTVIFGLIGNLINILVFTQLTIFRKKQSALYLTTASIIDSCALLFAALPRVVATIYGYNPTQTVFVWCKIGSYLAYYMSSSSALIICLASIDQYLSTSYNNRLRNLSTFKLAQYLIISTLIFIFLYCLPVLIFNKIYPIVGCIISNSIYSYFLSVVHAYILFGLIPIIISLTFSSLAYQNVRRRLDRQLTAMVLFRISLYIITTIIYIILRTYINFSSIDYNNSLNVAVRSLILMVATCVFNLNFSSSFYMFLIVSRRFCHQSRYLFQKKFCRFILSLIIKRNQVSPSDRIQPTISHESIAHIE